MLKEIEITLILPYLVNKDISISSFAVKIIGNICSISDNGINLIMKAGGIKIFKEILNSENPNVEILKEICWTISNILCNQIYLVDFIKEEIISDLCYLITTLNNYAVNKNIR